MHLASVAGIVTDAEMPASAKSMTIFAWTRDSPVAAVFTQKRKSLVLGSEGRAKQDLPSTSKRISPDQTYTRCRGSNEKVLDLGGVSDGPTQFDPRRQTW